MKVTTIGTSNIHHMARTCRIAVAILFAGIHFAASASTSSIDSVVCPIDGKPFEARTATSGMVFGKGLDLKPRGAIDAPFPLSKCPGNGFVLFKQQFTAEELVALRPVVLSREYQNLQKSESDYYLAAYLMRKVKAPKADVANTLLKATWEVDENKAKYERYAKDALAAFNSLIANRTDGSMSISQIASYQQLCAELERRLERFEEARTRLNDFAIAAGGSLESPISGAIKQELKLIDAKDSSPRLRESN